MDRPRLSRHIGFPTRFANPVSPFILMDRLV